MKDAIDLSQVIHGGFRVPHSASSLSPTRFRYYLRWRHLAQVIDEYPGNPEKYLRFFTVTINGKRRNIVTYKADRNGDFLRTIHRMMAICVRNRCVSSPHSYAYKEGSSTLLAVEQHMTASTFLKTDIHSFFDSIEFETITRMLFSRIPIMQRQEQFWRKVLAVCFYDGHLPIGFVSSPILSDLYLNDVDTYFSNMTDITYTRYADDFIISCSTEDAKTTLSRILDELRSKLDALHLELNKKKTYMRELRQEGDAIHVLGLNLVKTADSGNRITVSGQFIREVSKEFCQLLSEREFLDVWDARTRFYRIAGKISYITHVSASSAEKLKKLLFIKAGVQTDLTFGSLRQLCRLNADDLHSYEQTKFDEVLQHYRSIRLLPFSGRVWEHETINASNRPINEGTLRYYLHSLCRAIEDGLADISINEISLTIDHKTVVLRSKEDIPAFRMQIKGLRSIKDSMEYYADYSYRNPNDLPASKWGTVYLPANGFRPLIGYYMCSGTCIVFSQRENRWLFSVPSTNAVDELALVPCNDDYVSTQPKWSGCLAIDFSIPHAASHEDLMSLAAISNKFQNALNGHDFSTSVSERNVRLSFRGEIDSAELLSCVGAIREAVSLVIQDDGIYYVDGWFVPHGFFGSSTHQPFICFMVYSDRNGTLQVRCFPDESSYGRFV